MTDHACYAIAMSDREIVTEIKLSRRKCAFAWCNDIRRAMTFDRTQADALCAMINVRFPTAHHYVVEAP